MKCEHCTQFEKIGQCGASVNLECDCPRCQGLCECPQCEICDNFIEGEPLLFPWKNGYRQLCSDYCWEEAEDKIRIGKIEDEQYMREFS